MAQLKLTKTELRSHQNRLNQLETYLPTLQLKKAMLQIEVNEARNEISKLEENYKALRTQVDDFSALLTAKLAINIENIATIKTVHKHYENIAGVELPFYEGVTFEDFSYDLFETPPWVDVLISRMRSLSESFVMVTVAREKKAALEKELREVAIRVNLFEKILIPRSVSSIKKIKVFLGDLQLAAVAQAKVAKGKIEEAAAKNKLK